jgi:hypothetical protein
MRLRYGEIYAIRWNGGSYVGQTMVRSTSRWSEHVMKLRAGKHHNKRLQTAYYSVGMCGLSFSVLESGIVSDDLDDKEAYWTNQLGSVNALPKRKIREARWAEVIRLIKAGHKYRDIAKRLGMSLGSISGIKAQHDYEQKF